MNQFVRYLDQMPDSGKKNGAEAPLSQINLQVAAI
jgi:hypothetical protein